MIIIVCAIEGHSIEGIYLAHAPVTSNRCNYRNPIGAGAAGQEVTPLLLVGRYNVALAAVVPPTTLRGRAGQDDAVIHVASRLVPVTSSRCNSPGPCVRGSWILNENSRQMLPERMFRRPPRGSPDQVAGRFIDINATFTVGGIIGSINVCAQIIALDTFVPRPSMRMPES